MKMRAVLRCLYFLSIVTWCMLSACAAPQHSAPRWRFNIAQYDACLHSVRNGFRSDTVRGGKDVQGLVLLDAGARCLTAQGVGAIDGADLIRYAHVKCCVQYYKTGAYMHGSIAGVKEIPFAFPVRKYHECVSAVRADFARKIPQKPSIARGIVLLYEGGRCTSSIGLDRIGSEDVRRLTAGLPAPLVRRSP